MADLVADGVMSEGLTATRLGLSGIPPVAEVIMIERDLRLVELTGGRYHVSRVTTKAGIEAMVKSQKSGLSDDTAPHYFALNEDAVIDYRTLLFHHRYVRRSIGLLF